MRKIIPLLVLLLFTSAQAQSARFYKGDASLRLNPRRHEAIVIVSQSDHRQPQIVFRAQLTPGSAPSERNGLAEIIYSPSSLLVSYTASGEKVLFMLSGSSHQEEPLEKHTKRYVVYGLGSFTATNVMTSHELDDLFLR